MGSYNASISNHSGMAAPVNSTNPKKPGRAYGGNGSDTLLEDARKNFNSRNSYIQPFNNTLYFDAENDPAGMSPSLPHKINMNESPQHTRGRSIDDSDLNKRF